MMNKEAVKARLSVQTVLERLGFRRGWKDWMFFCACHPADKPTVVARNDRNKAHCQHPGCAVKNADVFGVIQAVKGCSFQESWRIASRMLEDQSWDAKLPFEMEEMPEDHSVVPALKPLLKTHQSWLEALLQNGQDWAVKRFEIKSWRRTHLAMPIDADGKSFVFFPVGAAKNAASSRNDTFYKGEKRDLQWFPQRPTLTAPGKKLMLCASELEAVILTVEVFRRGLGHEWCVLAATNHYRPLERLADAVNELPLLQYEEIVIVLPHGQQFDPVKKVLLELFKSAFGSCDRVSFWTMPLRVVDRNSFLQFIDSCRDNLPYPLADRPVDVPLAEQKEQPKRNNSVARRLLTATKEIYVDQPEGLDFLHTALCQVPMPRSETKARVYEQRNGNVYLRIESGPLFDGYDFIEQPLPFGSLPRLIMVYISTSAILNKDPVVDVGDSLTDFMKRLGLPTNGGKNGRMPLFKKQLNALISSRFTIGIRYDSSVSMIDTKPFSKFHAWFSETDKQKVLWPGYVHLSEEFYQSLLKHAVPLDPRALCSLKHSPFAMDVYTWMASRLYRIPNDKGLFLSWNNLAEQFTARGGELEEHGHEQERKPNVNLDSFRRNFMQALQCAVAVYPDARIEEVTDGRGYVRGYIFKNSPSAVPRSTKGILKP